MPKIHRPKDKDKFPEGSDAWEALSTDRSIKIDDNGFVVDVWDSRGNHYDLLGNFIPTSHLCGAPTEYKGNRTCKRKVRGSTGRCYQHRYKL